METGLCNDKLNMKIVETVYLLGKPSSQTNLVLDELKSILGKYSLILNPVKHGNGVKPIREAFVEILSQHGWTKEHGMNIEGMKRKALDGYKEFEDCRVGFEWETGNISSSFRAIMKLIMGLNCNELDVAIHVLPSKKMYRFLTDRVGNIEELRAYFPAFRLMNIPESKILIFVVVEHDEECETAVLVKKGLDGMSHSRRAKNGN